MTLSESSTVADNPLLRRIMLDEISANGPITFARFMDLALYHPTHGYYLAPERRPGRGGDFLTAPEASAYFGLTVARQIGECWQRLGRPTPFTIREYGAGIGGFAYDIMAGLADFDPVILQNLDYRLIEPNQHRLAQALSAMDEVGFGTIVSAEPHDAGAGLEHITGVVIANEVADALPVHRLIGRNGDLRELYTGVTNDEFVDVEGPLSPAVSEMPAYFAGHAIPIEDGAEYDVSPAATAWFRSACSGIERGYAIIIDYGYKAAELYRTHRLRGTVRGYFEHTVTDDPYLRIGEQDLTAHVDFTALQEAGESAGMQMAGFTTQGALLASLGLGERLLQLQREPGTSLADYMSAQAAVMRLIDPGGLGRFGVLMMAKAAPIEPPLLGLTTKPPGF